jgi:hypothetical protein
MVEDEQDTWSKIDVTVKAVGRIRLSLASNQLLVNCPEKDADAAQRPDQRHDSIF